MKIEAKVYKREFLGMPSLRATANITIDDCFVVKGILIMEGRNGLFMSMPSRRDKDGKYIDICFPITKEARQQIIDEIMKQYNIIFNEEQYEKEERQAIQNEENYEISDSDDYLPF